MGLSQLSGEVATADIAVSARVDDHPDASRDTEYFAGGH